MNKIKSGIAAITWPKGYCDVRIMCVLAMCALSNVLIIFKSIFIDKYDFILGWCVHISNNI